MREISGRTVVKNPELVYDSSNAAENHGTGGSENMGKTARMVMKIIGASLALAAIICLLIGGWHDLSVGVCGLKERLRQKKQMASEYADYADNEL